MRASAVAAMLACAALAAACGGSRAAPFRIGILSDCYGPGGGAHELNVAAAELPLIGRGAKLRGRTPEAGIRAVDVAGRRVELVLGCAAGTEEVIPEARRLVEEEGAEAIVGPQDPTQGMALRLYARTRPGTAFLIQPAAAPEITLIHPARNVFRFTLDAAQSNAGLGAYAYRQLGWRTAAVVADDVPYAWAQAAGFTAEFCALGGRIVKTVWVPFGMHPADAAAMVPGAADGVYLGQAIIPMSAFLTRYAAQGHDLARQLVASAEIVAGARALPPAAGVVVGGGAAAPPSAARRAYARAFARAFPSLPATEALSGTPPAFEIGVGAVLAALTRAHGKSGPPLLAALAALRFDSPLGRVRLDRHRQAVGPNWLGRVTPQGIAPLREVPGVEQTFGGYLTPATPPPSETSPTCTARTPPAWAR